MVARLSVASTGRSPSLHSVAGFLRSLEWFDGVAPAALDDLAGRLTVRRLPRGSVLWAPGDPSEEVFFVRSGVVKVIEAAEDARLVTLDCHGRGDLVGLGAMPERTDQAEVHEDATLLALSRRALDDWMCDHPTAAPRVVHAVARFGGRMRARLALLARHGAKARLAGLLVDLASRFGVRDSRGVIIDLRLTHRELASLIGATRETVSVAMVELRNDDIVRTEQRRVIVKDLDALRALLG